MDRIIIENVRCFRGRHEVPLAPLTFLVGENSTGKSTFLALARIAWDIAMEGQANFNEEPFLLGAYDQIASSYGKRSSPDFLVGWSRELSIGRRQPVLSSITGRFTSSRSQPTLTTWCCETSSFVLEAEYGADERPISLRAQAPSGTQRIDTEDWLFFSRGMNPPRAATILEEMRGDISIEDVKSFIELAVGWNDLNGSRPYAFAPIRTRPMRTYDPVKEVIDPEGGHVPLVLASIRSRDKESWSEIRGALDKFGKASGLFGKVEVRRLGKNESDPFQLQVIIDRMAINLLDVGYGVSQILPILVDCVRGDVEGLFLLQQPEIHLHPKAQAELGSFLAYLARRESKRFFVETHSDYLVDRIRIDLRDKKHGLRPDDVQILYFEREPSGVKIHQITFDKFGNLQNVPPGYRQFFLEEERRLLGI